MALAAAAALCLALLLLASCPQGTSGYDDFLFAWAKSRWYNPSLVEYQDNLISAAKVTSFKRTKYKTWWINHLFMCQGKKPDVHNMKCKPFNPWHGDYHECEFDTRVRGGKLDTSGLGDVKVWRWPGKGVYAIFGRKPERQPEEPYCSGQQVYYQFMAQVRSESSAAHEWDLQRPLRLFMGGSWKYPKNASYVMEKNWMPFIYKDKSGNEQLLATHMVKPHRVLKLSPDGAAVVLHESHDEKLFEKFAAHDVHGGPPVVLVPQQLSGNGQPYYLGIMHHIERFDNGKIRLYRHFAFKFEAEPPFKIYDISDELPLHFHKDVARPRTMYVAYVSGLFIANNGSVMITYGSADMQARMFHVPIKELEGMFTKKVEFLKQDTSSFDMKP